MSEMLSFSFMQRALLAAVLVGLLCSALSFFVVLKKLSFLGAGISHTALGGIAIGLVTGVDPVLTGSIFAVVTAMATGYISKLGKVGEDTVTGIFYASGMALGIALISSFKGYYPELFTLLFGNILAVTFKDLILMVIVLGAVLFFISLFFKELLALCFDEEMAEASGVPVNFIYMGLLAAMGLTVMVSIQLVGVVLVAALVVLPGAIASRLSNNYRTMLILSLLFGVSGSLAGLLFSYYFPVPPGAAIVLILAVLFGVIAIVKPLCEKLKPHKPGSQSPTNPDHKAPQTGQ